MKFLIDPGRLDFLGPSVTIHAAGFLEKVPQLLVVILCIVILFALGLGDDKKRFGPFFKLIVQFAVAIIAAFFADIRVEFFIENLVLKK